MPKRREKYAPGVLLAKSAQEYFENVRYDGSMRRYIGRMYERPFAEFFRDRDKYFGAYPELAAIVEKNACIEPAFVKKIRRQSGFGKHECYRRLAVMVGMGYIYMSEGKVYEAVKEYETAYIYIKKKLRIR